MVRGWQRRKVEGEGVVGKGRVGEKVKSKR